MDNKQDFINQTHDEQIASLEKHAQVANDEMGKIQTSMGVVQNDIAWIKEGLNKVDTKLWGIISAIAIVVIGEIVRFFLK